MGLARLGHPNLGEDTFRRIEEAFARVGAHLFPDPSEEFVTECSCPDWANPCKHVAAVLYGVGARFDRDPETFFTLRGVKLTELSFEAVSQATSRRITCASCREGMP